MIHNNNRPIKKHIKQNLKNNNSVKQSQQIYYFRNINIIYTTTARAPEKKRLEAFEMWWFRRMLKVRWKSQYKKKRCAN